MKKLVLALTAVAAFTGSASAADLGARPYAKAPVAVARPITGPAFTFSAVVAVACGLLTATCKLRPELLPSPAISAWW